MDKRATPRLPTPSSPLAGLLARFGVGLRKDVYWRKVADAVAAGDAPALGRLIENERDTFDAARFGCHFTAHRRWRTPPVIAGLEVLAAPRGLGAKAAVVSFDGGPVSYRLLVPGWQPPALRVRSVARLLNRIAHVHPLFEAFAAAGPARGRLVLDVDDITLSRDKVVGFSGPADRVFLVPDQIFVATEGYAELKASYAARWVPFAEREDRVFWRGRPTGSIRRSGGWQSLPRVRFVAAARELARTMPDVVFDVGMVRPDEQGGDVPWPEVVRAGLSAPFVPIETFVRQAIHVDIDGNSNSWPGLFSKLLLGGAILKVRSPYSQWYYDRLDGVVAPVAEDLGDLAETITRVRSGGEAAQLAEAARSLSATMTYEAELERAFPTIAAALAHWTAKV